MQLLATQGRFAGLKAGAARRPALAARVPARLGQGARRSVAARAADEAFDVDKVVKDLGEKWDKIDNKTNVLVYGAGAILVLWLSSTIVGAVDRVPLIPKLLELVGLGYTAWFVYRYLLFQSSRDELAKDVDELKKKITGGDL